MHNFLLLSVGLRFLTLFGKRIKIFSTQSNDRSVQRRQGYFTLLVSIYKVVDARFIYSHLLYRWRPGKKGKAKFETVMLPVSPFAP